jgi:ribonuclease VapC
VIIVDTSALMAVVLDEPAAEACSEVLARASEIALSAGTLAEALIVAGRRNVGPVLERLIRGLGCQVVPVTGPDAHDVAQAYAQWGKGCTAPA